MPPLATTPFSFTLGSNTWRSLKGGHPHFIHTQGVCINGTIYGKNKPYNYGPFGIAAFDVGDERYQMIQLPFPHEADMMTDHMGSVLIRVGEDLALVDYEHLVKGNIITMWVLQINHQDKVWAEKRIEFPSHWRGVPEANTCFLMKPMLVFTVHTGEIVLIPSVLSKNFGVFYYDMENKSLREVKVSRLPDYGMTHYPRALFALFATEVVENVLSWRDTSSYISAHIDFFFNSILLF